MIGAMAFEIRRALRRRLTVLAVAVPLALVLYVLIGKWIGRPLSPLTPELVILSSSFVMFGQALLSDREGRFDAALTIAPLPAGFPVFRRALLLAIPLGLQVLVYRVLVSVLGLA